MNFITSRFTRRGGLRIRRSFVDSRVRAKEGPCGHLSRFARLLARRHIAIRGVTNRHECLDAMHRIRGLDASRNISQPAETASGFTFRVCLRTPILHHDFSSTNWSMGRKIVCSVRPFD